MSIPIQTGFNVQSLSSLLTHLVPYRDFFRYILIFHETHAHTHPPLPHALPPQTQILVSGFDNSISIREESNQTTVLLEFDSDIHVNN